MEYSDEGDETIHLGGQTNKFVRYKNGESLQNTKCQYAHLSEREAIQMQNEKKRSPNVFLHAYCIKLNVCKGDRKFMS